MLVLAAMSRVGAVSTTEGAANKVGPPEVHDALRRMERPEDFWDILWALTNDRILELQKLSRGDVRFAVVDVQAHDVDVFLHQNREELESFQALEDDEDALTKVYLDGLEESRSRAVFY